MNWWLETVEAAEDRRRKAADALAEAEGALRDAAIAEREAERLAGEARRSRARAEARLDAAREGVALAAERIAEEDDRTPDELLTSLRTDPDKMPDAETLDHDVSRLKRQREALGAVNLRAEEDAKAVETEFDTTAAERPILRKRSRSSRTGSWSEQGGPRASADRLRAGECQFLDPFHPSLRQGREARLVLAGRSGDPLEAGLEILCQPPGKKLATLTAVGRRADPDRAC